MGGGPRSGRSRRLMSKTRKSVKNCEHLGKNSQKSTRIAHISFVRHRNRAFSCTHFRTFLAQPEGAAAVWAVAQNRRSVGGPAVRGVAWLSGPPHRTELLARCQLRRDIPQHAAEGVSAVTRRIHIPFQRSSRRGFAIRECAIPHFIL